MKKYTLTLILALVSLGLYAQTNRNKTIINAACMVGSTKSKREST